MASNFYAILCFVYASGASLNLSPGCIINIDVGSDVAHDRCRELHAASSRSNEKRAASSGPMRGVAYRPDTWLDSARFDNPSERASERTTTTTTTAASVETSSPGRSMNHLVGPNWRAQTNPRSCYVLDGELKSLASG